MPTINPEEFEGYEERFIPKGGGGGSRQHRDPNSKTSKTAREKVVEQAELNRREGAQEKVSKVINNFPEFSSQDKEDRFIERYVAWVKASFQQKIPVLDEKTDLQFEFVPSHKHAGGQNLNKVSSAVRCTHKITNISVRNEETRNQIDNKEKAIILLNTNLSNHLDDWKIFLKNISDISPELIKKLYS